VRFGLRAQVLAIQAGIVLLVVAAVSAAYIAILSRLIEREYGDRVMSVAQTVALMSPIVRAFDDPDPSATIQPLTEAITERAGVTFVVISNREHVRYSHPVLERIGQLVAFDDRLALEGIAEITTDETGTLGRAIRAKVPIYRDDQVIGVATVGILGRSAEDLLQSYWPQIGAVALGALVVGGWISWLLASHIKREMFGLEPRQIATRLEQRDAMLRCIREGVIAIDREGLVDVANDEARRLLDLQDDVTGRSIGEVVPASGLPTVVESGQPAEDQLLLTTSGRVMVVNRMPVHVRGDLVGAIATFRDQTEVQRLASELSGARSHLDALRAQAHEFANKLHTISGLIEMGRPERAVALVRATTQQQQALIEELPQRIQEPAVAALLLGKTSVAAERGITLDVAPDSRLGPVGELADDLVTALGNLIENAVDRRPARVVRVEIGDDGLKIEARVRDTGPGVRPEHLQHIFEQGFTTKQDGVHGRGLGLVLARRAVARWGGELSVHNQDGAVFELLLPRVVRAASVSQPLRRPNGEVA
jgi:two-component system CitB family sensor kinase